MESDSKSDSRATRKLKIRTHHSIQNFVNFILVLRLIPSHSPNIASEKRKKILSYRKFKYTILFLHTIYL